MCSERAFAFFGWVRRIRHLLESVNGLHSKLFCSATSLACGEKKNRFLPSAKMINRLAWTWFDIKMIYKTNIHQDKKCVPLLVLSSKSKKKTKHAAVIARTHDYMDFHLFLFTLTYKCEQNVKMPSLQSSIPSALIYPQTRYWYWEFLPLQGLTAPGRKKKRWQSGQCVTNTAENSIYKLLKKSTDKSICTL